MKKYQKILIIALFILGSLLITAGMFGKLEHWSQSFILFITVTGFVLDAFAVFAAVWLERKQKTEI